nr:winged helix-turn-helix domain-containing protein [Tumebacillus amylolyticus]
MQFQPDFLSVSYKGLTLALLPKEYALLDFLYQNRGHAFTREELLDRVWPLETPIDRTVDDHVYRLRKKMKPWADVVSLDTVRSIGYRLTVKDVRPMTVMPSHQDAELKEFAAKMLHKYHLFGQGDAIQMLYQQQKVLGIELDPFYEIYVRFISGDLMWLAEATNVPIENRLYLLLITYVLAGENPQEAVDFIERAFASGLLPEKHRQELYILDMLFPMMMAGQVEQALERFEKVSYPTIEEQGWERGFLMPTLLAESAAFFLTGQYERLEAQLDRVEAMIQEAPYLRESGYYRLARGVWEIHNGRKAVGKATLDEGFDILRQSKFVPQYLLFLRKAVFFFEKHLDEPELYREYRALWKDACKQYRLEEVAGKIRETLRKILS